MTHCTNGMIQQHTRAGKTHNSANFFAHFGTIAMNGAARTKRFFRHHRTMLNAFEARSRKVPDIPGKGRTMCRAVFCSKDESSARQAFFHCCAFGQVLFPSCQHLPLLNPNLLICNAHGGSAMADQYKGLFSALGVQRVQNDGLIQAVKVAGWFIQQHQGSIVQKMPVQCQCADARRRKGCRQALPHLFHTLVGAIQSAHGWKPFYRRQ